MLKNSSKVLAESGNIININTLKQEIEQDQELNRLDDTSRDINPYKELIVNNAGKIETVLSQMEQWSIFSSMDCDGGQSIICATMNVSSVLAPHSWGALLREGSTSLNGLNLLLNH